MFTLLHTVATEESLTRHQSSIDQCCHSCSHSCALQASLSDDELEYSGPQSHARTSQPGHRRLDSDDDDDSDYDAELLGHSLEKPTDTAKKVIQRGACSFSPICITEDAVICTVKFGAVSGAQAEMHLVWQRRIRHPSNAMWSTSHFASIVFFGFKVCVFSACMYPGADC